MRMFIRVIRRHRGHLVVLVPAFIVTAILENLMIATLYPLLTLALSTPSFEGGGAVLTGLGRLVSGFPPEQRLFAAAALFLTMVPLDIGGRFLREWLQVRVSTQIAFDTKKHLFARILVAPHEYFLGRRHGDLTYRLSTAPLNFALAILLLATIAGLIASSLATIVLLATIEWRTTIAMVALGLLYFFANRYIARSQSVGAGRARQTAQAAELGIVHEFLTGAKEIAVVGTGHTWANRFAVEAAAFRRSYVREYLAAISPGLLLELLVLFSAGVLILALKIFSPDTVVGLLPLVAVYAYATRHLLGFLGSISRQALRVAGLSPDVALLEDALTERYPIVREGTRTDVPVWSRLDIEGISFAYPGQKASVLEDLTLAVPGRGMTAIVGRSGAGKSTVLYVLLRLFDPQRGHVRVDGVDVWDWQRSAWLREVGYVGQEPFVYRASVSDNIAFGRDVTPGTVERVARLAHADEFIRALPQGYGTILADRGSSLSAGQRQRLAIARALVGEPRLLLLDEVTSALDAESERLVQETLERVGASCAVVVVAHSLSFVRAAEQIVVLESGHVVERGRHDELMARGGSYAGLVQAAQRPSVVT